MLCFLLKVTMVLEVLSFPIGPVHISLFHDDAAMRQICEADFCLQLECEVQIRHFLEQFYISTTVLIREGMALLQSMHVNICRTFADSATSFVQSQLSCFPITCFIIDVFDRYDGKLSIKAAEQISYCERYNFFPGYRRPIYSRLEDFNECYEKQTSIVSFYWRLYCSKAW